MSSDSEGREVNLIHARLDLPSELCCLPLVGAYYRGESAKKVLKSMSSDINLVFLKAEPSNPYDSNALKVIYSTKRIHIGYVQRHGALKLNRFLISRQVDLGKDASLAIACNMTPLDSGDWEIRPLVICKFDLINLIKYPSSISHVKSYLHVFEESEPLKQPPKVDNFFQEIGKK